MPDAAGQPEGGRDLETHLEELLGEIEATLHEVEARSPGADNADQDEQEINNETGDEPADVSESEPVPSEAGDDALGAIDDLEADLGDLVDAIYELDDPDAAVEPLIESECEKPEPDAAAEDAVAQKETQTSEPAAEATSQDEDALDATVEEGASPDAASEEDILTETAEETVPKAEDEAEPPAPDESVDQAEDETLETQELEGLEEVDEVDEAARIAEEALADLGLDQPASDAEPGAKSDSEAGDDDGFGVALDDIAGELERMLGSGGEEPETPDVESEAPAPIAESADQELIEQETDVEAAEEPEASEAEPVETVAAIADGASDNDASGDSLDDMLAAASQELLVEESMDPAPIDAAEPASAIDENTLQPVINAESEMVDALQQIGDLQRPSTEESDEVAAGMVEIPGGAPTDSAPEPEAEAPPAEPESTEEFIAPEPKPELPPPTGRLAPLIIVWRWTRKNLEPAARAGVRRATPMLAEAVLVAAKPLREKPKSMRDTVGWIAIYTAFLALCLWVFALGFRSGSSADTGASDARVVMPDGAPIAPVP